MKRKASGAQKQYEDKIKAKKKAEMDAKKALIRAEDMKKGVFSTIGRYQKKIAQRQHSSQRSSLNHHEAKENENE